MTENMKAFVEQIEKEGLLKAELEAMSKEYGEDKESLLDAKEAIAQKTTAIAAKHGFTLTPEDFNQDAEELSPYQLDAVTGGGDSESCCSCTVFGTGKGFEDENGRCICIGTGYGGSDNGHGSAVYRCYCTIFGEGAD